MRVFKGWVNRTSHLSLTAVNLDRTDDIIITIIMTSLSRHSAHFYFSHVIFTRDSYLHVCSLLLFLLQFPHDSFTFRMISSWRLKTDFNSVFQASEQIYYGNTEGTFIKYPHSSLVCMWKPYKSYETDLNGVLIKQGTGQRASSSHSQMENCMRISSTTLKER